MAGTPDPSFDQADQRRVVAATFTRWLGNATTRIGVFENKDLGHRDVGRRIALPYEAKDLDQAELGKAQAPDSAIIGFGWRYLLVAKCSTVDEALAELEKGGAL
jgi:hypothetical protein